MKKTKLNIFVDIVAFLAFLVSLISGLVLWQVLPSGEGFQGGRGELTEKIFLGMERHDWLEIHDISSLLFAVIVLLHIILHWDLIVAIFNRMFPSKNLKYGIAGFICFFGLIMLISPFILEPEQVPFEPRYRNRPDYIAPSVNKLPETTVKEVFPVQQAAEQVKTVSPSGISGSPGVTAHEDRHPEYDEYEVYGYHTLQYISSRYNVPVAVITRDLKIPDNLSGDRLSWLRKRYGFTMTDVRESIYNYKKQHK